MSYTYQSGANRESANNAESTYKQAGFGAEGEQSHGGVTKRRKTTIGDGPVSGLPDGVCWRCHGSIGERGEDAHPLVCEACEAWQIHAEGSYQLAMADAVAEGIEYGYERTADPDVFLMTAETEGPAGLRAMTLGVLFGWFMRTMVPLASSVTGAQLRRARWDRAVGRLAGTVATMHPERWDEAIAAANAAARDLPPVLRARALRVVGGHEETHRAALALRAAWRAGTFDPFAELGASE